MNLQSKKARVPIAALGVTALVAGGGWMGAFASSAFAVAPTSIDLNSGATSPSVANLGYGTAAAAATAYAAKIQDSSDSSIALGLESGPTGGTLAFEKVASNGAANTSFSTLPVAGLNEVETVTFGGAAATGGNFTLTYGGQTTSGLLYSSNGAAVQTALQGLSSIGAGNATVTGGNNGPYTVTFAGTLAGTDVSPITASAAGITNAGGTSTIAVATTTNGGKSVALGTVANTDNLYLTGTVPGTYTVRLYQDGNGNYVYDSADERSSSLINLTVYDAGGTGTTATTSDDVTLALTATTPTDIGPAILVKAAYSKPLSLSDARGSGGSGLGASLAALTVMDASATAGLSLVTDAALTYSATDGLSYTTAATTASGDVAFHADLVPTLTGGDDDSAVSFGTKTVSVADNAVTGITLTESSGQTANVVEVSGAEKVRTGTGTVKYTATVAPAAVGKKVYFTLIGTSGIALTDLTANGAAVPTNGIVSVTTDADGNAELVVVSTKTAATNAYSVQASSNNHTSDNTTGGGTDPITATYTTAAATSFTTSGGTAQTVGGSVTLSGQVLDQWLVGYNAGGQATLTVTRGGGIGTNISRGVDIASNGKFTTVVADATGNTTAHTDTYTWTGISGGPSNESIFWVSSLSVATAAFTGLGANATFPVPDTFTPPMADHSSLHSIQVTGTLKDGSAAAVPYAPFTLTGTDGVKFLDDDDQVVSTFTGTANASGQLSDGTHTYVRVLFTTSGTTTLTLTSGTTTATSGAFMTADPTDGWKITVNDAASSPGATIIVTGKVSDLFGNGVPSYTVNLDLGASTIGALGAAQVNTNSQGVFSTTFISGSNQSGAATLTAKLAPFGTSMTTNPLINGVYADAGFTVDAHGEYQDAATITVATVALTLSATDAVKSGADGGTAELSGTFLPNTSVDIYAKQSGDLSYQLADSVTSDAQGDWGTSIMIKKSTYFLAKASGMSSSSEQTVVTSSVSLKAKTTTKHRVILTANGAPDAIGVLTFYRSISGPDVPLASVKSDEDGVGVATVTLPKGTRYVYVTFKAPGTGVGQSTTLTVAVK